MKRITALARIVDQQGAARRSLKVRLQVFSLSQAAWTDVAAGLTDQAGNLRLTAQLELPDDRPAPNLRLLRAEGEAVLSDGGPIQYARDTLTVQFGEIQDLGEQTVAPIVIGGRFRGDIGRIGGVATPVAGAAVREGGAADVQALNLKVAAEAERARDLQTRLDAVTRERETLATTRLPKLEADVAALTREKERLSGEAARIPQLESRLDSVTREKEQLTVEARRVPELEGRIATLNQEKSRLQAEASRVREMERKLEEAKAERERLSAPTEKKVEVSAVATNLGAQINQAQRTIREQPGSLALSGVRIRFKGLVEDAGNKVTLPGMGDLEKAEAAGALADVDLDFAAETAPSAPDMVEVPDVRRLTEGAVRQVLHSLGLRLDAVQGPAGAGGVAAGQASLQAPAAGERTGRGSAVTVVFAT